MVLGLELRREAQGHARAQHAVVFLALLLLTCLLLGVGVHARLVGHRGRVTVPAFATTVSRVNRNPHISGQDVSGLEADIAVRSESVQRDGRREDTVFASS